MNLPDKSTPDPATAPLDDVDAAILDWLRELCVAADPMPDDLVERIQFALTLEDLNVEVFRLCAQPDALAGAARGDEESRTITFDSETLTIMVSLSPVTAATLRLDGWLAPPAGHVVELRTAGGQLTTTADEHGRFVLAEVPHGLAQLVVHPVEGRTSGEPRAVVTPSIVL
jgi:hypothetical protein